MTTFFDVEPISPSGRYLAVTKVPAIWRIPYPGDVAEIWVVDLQNRTGTPVYRTRGWGAQLGANVQWGKDDDTLFCNDLIDGNATGVRIDRKLAHGVPLNGPIYGLSPDKAFSFSGRLDYINAALPGYGVPERLFHHPRQQIAESNVDGIWRTDLGTGKSELFLSISEIVNALPEQEHLKGSTYYIFHVKINKQGTRGFAVLFTRNTPRRAGWPRQLVTFDLNGGNIRLAMPDRLWRVGGHHPSWLPDGDHILMNLRRRKSMEFVRFLYDGTDLVALAPGNAGGGHPSMNPKSSHILTDAYYSEGFRDKNGDVPIRCIDLATNIDDPLARVSTVRGDSSRRVDPHPAWSGDGSQVVFNGLVKGKRQVMIGDTSAL
ncbi:MAG: hypothetical protein K0U78_01910 [Actinomycetia bacterium]|nr:hypothetical protein [Actinomycetes bacterium]